MQYHGTRMSVPVMAVNLLREHLQVCVQASVARDEWCVCAGPSLLMPLLGIILIPCVCCLSVCICVCVCLWGRERESKRAVVSGGSWRVTWPPNQSTSWEIILLSGSREEGPRLGRVRDWSRLRGRERGDGKRWRDGAGWGGGVEAWLKLINLLDAQTEKAVQDSNDFFNTVFQSRSWF